MDQAEGDGVGTHTERAPLLRDGLCQTDDRSFGSGVVRLPDVPVQT